MNPEPVADFIDAFVIGREGKRLSPRLLRPCATAVTGLDRSGMLRALASMTGIYVPRYYERRNDAAGRFIGVFPVEPELPQRIRKRIVRDFADFPLPEKVVVPWWSLSTTGLASRFAAAVPGDADSVRPA